MQALPFNAALGIPELLNSYQVSVLATVYQARDAVSRCLSPAAAGEILEDEGAVGLAVVVLVAAFLYSLDSAPGIKN